MKHIDHLLYGSEMHGLTTYCLKVVLSVICVTFIDILSDPLLSYEETGQKKEGLLSLDNGFAMCLFKCTQSKSLITIY